MDLFLKKPLLVFTNSPPNVHKAHPKTMTKIRKTTFGEFLEKRSSKVCSILQNHDTYIKY